MSGSGAAEEVSKNRGRGPGRHLPGRCYRFSRLPVAGSILDHLRIDMPDQYAGITGIICWLDETEEWQEVRIPTPEFIIIKAYLADVEEKAEAVLSTWPRWLVSWKRRSMQYAAASDRLCNHGPRLGSDQVNTHWPRFIDTEMTSCFG